jgi:hypothetical protein
MPPLSSQTMGVDITADKLQTLIKVAKIEEVEPIWTSLFAKALEGKDVKDLLLGVSYRATRAVLPRFDTTVGAVMLSRLGRDTLPSAQDVKVRLYASQ